MGFGIIEGLNNSQYYGRVYLWYRVPQIDLKTILESM